jgi:transcriptional regulator with XRE-family HTH domain
VTPPRAPKTLTAGRGYAREGRISGFTLKLIREHADLTQDRFAEYLGVDTCTVQGWESGRRSLAATSTGHYLALKATLTRLGSGRFLPTLDLALEADLCLGHVLNGAPGPHPLAEQVMTRAYADLLSWPITGATPAALTTVRPRRRRGPVPTAPVLDFDERSMFFDRIRADAETADLGRPSTSPRGTTGSKQLIGSPRSTT